MLDFFTHVSFVGILLIGCLIVIFYMLFRSLKKRAR